MPQCDSCGYNLSEPTKVKGYVLEGNEERFCHICARTIPYPTERHERHILQALSYCTNAILESVERKDVEDGDRGLSQTRAIERQSQTAIKKVRLFLDRFPPNDKMDVSKHTTVSVEDIKALRAVMPED